MIPTTITYPRFAVVGHPNKGKSSIVAALAQDDSVAISKVPGTTHEQKSYPLKVDGRTIYELIDTPGFQRARQVLSWLKSHHVSASKRYEVVEKFIDTYRHDSKFHDEIELLTPIMQGAGIIYVVDASKPYGEEYEAEMEILQWTGQPSMALLNHIDEDDYSQEWKRALNQYFKSVRTFNPMQVDATQHISILESMAQLKEEWTPIVKESITLFEAYTRQKIEQSAEVITALVSTALSHTEKMPLKSDQASQKEKEEVQEHYKTFLRKLEYQAHGKIEQIWQHEKIEVKEKPLLFEGMDLFSEASADIFGLTRKELMITAATTGAVTGAGIDLLFAGHTLLLGGAIGAVVGGVGAYFGFNELSEVKVLGQRLGKRYLKMGPMENRNFPYILLGRALYLTQKIAKRSHALRNPLHLEMKQSFKDQWLDEDSRKALEKYHKMFQKEELDEESIHAYRSLLADIIHKLLNQ